MNIRQPVNSEHAEQMGTSALRRNFLIESVFEPGAITLNYTHIDRVIAGGCMPTSDAVALSVGDITGTEFFLERRELGVINIGGAGSVSLDGVDHALGGREALYVGSGVREVVFRSDSATAPARFYLNSAPAHRELPAKRITQEMASPETLGEAESSNRRTIYKYLVPDVVETCQLLMGLTELEPGSIWNTMPCHTHERRMEIYFYFDMQQENLVFHMMGRPDETRHIVVRNEQAVISPSWSIHSGVGTANYNFIWGMAGENQVFSDMDFVDMSTLK